MIFRWRSAVGWLLTAFLLLAYIPPAWGGSLDETLTAGVSLYRSGDFEGAAEKFRYVLGQDPGSESALRNLANTLAAQGQRSFRAGRWEEAGEYFEEAIEHWPEDPSFHAVLGLILFKRGDLHGARWELDDALEIDPDHALAREVRGDVYYQEGYLSQAVPEWEAALKGNNSPHLREKIARAEKELETELSFSRDVSPHFTLQSDGPVPMEVSRMVLDHLEESYDRIGEELGHYPRNDIPVILYSRALFKEISLSPDWASGSYDGKIRVPVGGLAEGVHQRRLQGILSHELTHAILRSMAPQGLPRWFEEGLAKYFEGLTRDAAVAWLENHDQSGYTSFDALDMGLRGKAGSVDAAYLSAFLAVWALIDEEGTWTVRRIIEEVGSGRPFPQVFASETAMDLNEFRDTWIRSLP